MVESVKLAELQLFSPESFKTLNLYYRQFLRLVAGFWSDLGLHEVSETTGTGKLGWNASRDLDVNRSLFRAPAENN